MLRPIVVLTALAAALLAAAAPAHATPPRSAEAFARVLEEADARVTKASRGLAARVKVSLDPCVETLAKGAKALQDEEQAIDVMALFLHAAFEEAVFKPMLPEYARISQELDRIPTNDPVLRTGRAVWRKWYDALLRIQRVPDACARLEQWRLAAFAPAARPDIPKLDALDLVLEDTAGDDAKAARGARRLRALGISARRARRFDGEHIFLALERELDKVEFDDPTR